MTVLVLGGTGEARALADRLVEAGVPVVSSLQGGVRRPLLPAGEVRLGGFGGAAGLAAYVRERRVAAVVDATHPFAATITANAAAACAATGVPLLRLARPGWGGRPDAAGWHWVDDLAAARAAADRLGRRVFLSIGRNRLADWYAGDTSPADERYVLVRVVDGAGLVVPASWEALTDRGPFTREGERDLLRSRRIDVVVTKDSGGEATAAKLDAAADLGVPVVIVRRPPDPPGVPTVATVADAAAWVSSRGRGADASHAG